MSELEREWSDRTRGPYLVYGILVRLGNFLFFEHPGFCEIRVVTHV